MSKRYNGIETLRRIAAQLGQPVGEVDIDDPIHYEQPERTGPVIEVEEWRGTCICDENTPEGDQPTFGHYNQAGGFCCPHHGNTCGHCHEYDRRRVS